MGRAKNIFKELLRGAFVVMVWILFAIFLRPAFLIAEIVIALFEFIADVATFPVQFMRRIKFNEDCKSREDKEDPK